MSFKKPKTVCCLLKLLVDCWRKLMFGKFFCNCVFLCCSFRFFDFVDCEILNYEITQLLFSWGLLPLSLSICCKIKWKISATDSFCLADVSKNWAFQDSATFLPSSNVTARSWCKSVLFPTKTTGTLKYKEVAIKIFYQLFWEVFSLTKLSPWHPAISHKLFWWLQMTFG